MNIVSTTLQVRETKSEAMAKVNTVNNAELTTLQIIMLP